MKRQQQVEQRSRVAKNYYIYGIHTHGTGLNSIRNEFIRQVGTGLRRNVCVIDVQEIQNVLDKQANNLPYKQSKDSKRNSYNQLISIVLQNIEDLRKAYDAATRRIAEELKFDLYQYWLKNLEDKLVESLVDTASLRGKQMGNLSAVTNARKNRGSLKQAKKAVVDRPSVSLDDEEICMELVRKEHHRVGRQEMLSQKKFIRDEPAADKIFFILIGSMNEQFYADLIRRDQPVQGIINFIPSESNYDLLLNNNKLRDFIQQSIESIDHSVIKFRQDATLKPIGLFVHNLPVISECLARKYQKDIYDQLSWAVYDIEVLHQLYNNYYYIPFREADVKLPADVDLLQTQEMAASLSLRGYFQINDYAGSSSDISTIITYLDSLLNTCAVREKTLSKMEIILLSMTDYGLPKSNQVIRDLIRDNISAFSSITKIRKFERVFVEESNHMLVNAFQHTNQLMFRNIYLSCLDYKLWRALVTSFRPKPTIVGNSLCEAAFELPGYVKVYTSGVSCAQRIIELNDKYNGFHMKDLQPDYKLYTFRRIYNFVDEKETMNVIPTRLCFRDFTLFQMNEFYKDLVMPDKQKSLTDLSPSSSLTIAKRGSNGKKTKAYDFNESIFIRLNSLKALRLSSEKENEQTVTQREKDQKSSRKRTSGGVRKASSRLSKEDVGLPSEHHLLKGYNLEDTRQEIRTKTSTYMFHHGKIQLYEERWCFQDMNQTLKFDINNCELYLNRPRSQKSGILQNIRLKTSKNVTVRILNKPEECAKVVINYPNGLCIFHHDIECEQFWVGECSRLHERRRIVTPYGAVVVFYQKNDMILIMRNNGEIYRLYQYDITAVEEEEEDQSMLSEFTNNQSSEYMDNKAQGDNLKNYKTPNAANKEYNRGQGDSSRGIYQYKAEEEDSEATSMSSSYIAEHLRLSIEFELLFFEAIASIYNLSYIHLKITTSSGKCIHITMDGKIMKCPSLNLDEWHDYFANESYAQRSDGVKMIWTKDSLKCYHKDGTVFTTKTAEKIDPITQYEDGFEITQSSSHQHLEEEEEYQNSLKFSKGIYFQSTNFNETEACGEEEAEDKSFAEYTLLSMLIQHIQYAEVYFIWTNKSSSSLDSMSNVLMEISAASDICVVCSLQNASSLQFPDSSLERSSYYEEGLEEHNKNELSITVSVGNNLDFIVFPDGLEIIAVMDHFHAKAIEPCISDNLTLRILFKDCLTDVFAYLQNKIAAFHNYDGPIEENMYFIELKGNDCSEKGFEFISKLPDTLLYEHSNSLLHFTQLKNINEAMLLDIADYKDDMNKFPRFRSRRESNKIPDIPMVLTTSVYCAIPASLRCTNEICKFVEPFMDINFKSMRDKFKHFLDMELRPKLKMDLKNLISKKNWAKRKRDHERRKFMETQRLGLYHAMLKHKTYPNYFKFTKDYRGNVSDIDFFEFMQVKCKGKEVLRDEVYWKSADWRGKPNTLKENECLYGTYDDP